MWIAVSLRSVCWVRTLSLRGRQKVRAVACSHQADVSVLCNTISSVRILSHSVKCGHCLLLLQIFTSGLFPRLLGRGSLLCDPGLSTNCPSFCASMHVWHLPHPAMVGTLAPVVSTTTPRTVSPVFPQSWNESGGGGGGCLVSHSPHSRCFFQISKLPRATPHTWLCHLCIWLAPSLSWRSLSAPSRRAPALSWHGFPSSRSGRHPGVLWLCGPALETHAGC